MNIPSAYIHTFRSLFKGRQDVFAVRWENGSKSGYRASYSYDPYHYRLYKMKGGSFHNYPHKKPLPLSDEEVKRHLLGSQQIGIYPMLKDDTSWFIAADFDKRAIF